MKFIYKSNSKKEKKILGKKFLSLNKKKAYLIIQNKKLNLLEKINQLYPFEIYLNLLFDFYSSLFKENNNKVLSDIINHKIKELIDEENDFTFKIKILLLDNILNIDSMFKECKTLISLPDISKLKTKYIKNMNSLFCGCSSLKYLDNISNWNTKNVTNINEAFSGCKSLENLPDISKWKFDNIKSMSRLFQGCSSLKYLPDISKWDLKILMIFQDYFLNVPI